MKELMWKLLARVLARPAVADYLIKRAKKTPYSHIYKDGDCYMERYWLFNPYALTDEEKAAQKWWQKRLPSVRLHRIRQEDRDRASHDHPWQARTIILKGGYSEQRVADHRRSRNGRWVTFHTFHARVAGSTAPINFGEYHQITEVYGETWTIFITWKYMGTWGFLVDGVKVPWREYLNAGKTE